MVLSSRKSSVLRRVVLESKKVGKKVGKNIFAKIVMERRISVSVRGMDEMNE